MLQFGQAGTHICSYICSCICSYICNRRMKHADHGGMVRFEFDGRIGVAGHLGLGGLDAEAEALYDTEHLHRIGDAWIAVVNHAGLTEVLRIDGADEKTPGFR